MIAWYIAKSHNADMTRESMGSPTKSERITIKNLFAKRPLYERSGVDIVGLKYS